MSTTALALVGLASLLAGWMLMFILPGARVYGWSVIALGAAVMAAALVVDFRRVKKALTGRRGRFGASATVMVSLFAGIILLANAISVTVHHRFDFTGLAQFTLTSQTKDVLARLEEPVEVVSFFSPQVPPVISTYAGSLLQEYGNATGLLSLSTFDPDLRPDLARQYGVDRVGAAYGAVVFRGREGQRVVIGPEIAAGAEHAFTTAILEVTGTKQKKVYFLAGHGEAGIDGAYSSAADGLRDNLFHVEELDLALTPRIPDDAALLVIAGVRRPIGSAEGEAIRSYLRDRGKALVLFDPDPPQWVRGLLAEWGMDVGQGTLIDPASHVAPNNDNILVPRARNSFGLAETHFPGAAAVIPKQGMPRTHELTALVWTSPEAQPAGSAGNAGRATGQGPEGPQTAGLAIGALLDTAGAPPGGAAAPGTRLVAIGDSDFASNAHFRNGSNSQLFLTAVNWLAEGEQIISVDRKVLVTRRLLLTPEQARFLHLSSIGLLPLLVLAAGGYVWWRKR
jgi:ABC-type uncharacterized transport system involved in gliding motility auxiliary subunit